MSLRHHEIAEASHRILDPFTDQKLRLLGEVACVQPRYARAGPCLRQGRDALPLVRMVRERWRRRGPVARVPGSGGSSEPPSWASRTASRSSRARPRPMLPKRPAPSTSRRALARRGSAVALGDDGAPAPRHSRRRPAHRGRAVPHRGAAGGGARGVGFRARRLPSLAGTAERLDPPAGWTCWRWSWRTRHSWDRYEASQWRTIADWLAANPDDPDHEAMRRFLDDNRRTCTCGGGAGTWAGGSSSRGRARASPRVAASPAAGPASPRVARGS